jgi:hypothetical protein
MLNFYTDMLRNNSILRIYAYCHPEFAKDLYLRAIRSFLEPRQDDKRLIKFFFVDSNADANQYKTRHNGCYNSEKRLQVTSTNPQF